MDLTKYDVLKENLLSTKEILSLLNIRWCLMWGSLLGAVREKRIIRMDRPRNEDIDIAFLDYDNAMFKAFSKCMIMAGFEPNHITSNPASFIKNGEEIDVYRFFKKKDKYFFHDVGFSKNFFDILTFCDFENTICPIPFFSEEFLTLIYKNWKKPVYESANIRDYRKRITIS